MFCSEAVVSQVLDELGIELAGQLTDLPTATGSLNPASATGAAAKTPTLDPNADLEARLNILRR